MAPLLRDVTGIEVRRGEQGYLPDMRNDEPAVDHLWHRRTLMNVYHPHRSRPAPSKLPHNPALADVVERNICTLVDARRDEEERKSFQDRAADAITGFSGSMSFVYLHAVLFAGWIVANTGWLGNKPVDPFPFNFLTMVVSLEAIFLSTFVLVSQNRMAEVADKRADLDLQINLLAEHEVTRILKLVDAIADKLGIEGVKDPEIEELERDVMPEVVLQELEQREQDRKG
jgi:uncharacterized membrane protein